MPTADSIRAAQLVVPCRDLAATLAFFTGELGFRVELVMPADAPALAVVAGYGATLRLERSDRDSDQTLHVLCASAPAEPERVAPNGMRIRFVSQSAPGTLPPFRPEFVLRRAGDEAFQPGRAGMEYRDLIPGRLGGRYIASHIRIPEGGPVADWVHYHAVRFQMIYCRSGWVRVVYEDQGPPFVLEAGDCVLQPPIIRHRVLEASPGLEVIELGCPAEHETHADHALKLPTPGLQSTRDFSGQRFVRHEAARGSWTATATPGIEARDTGIAEATRGAAGARVLRPIAGAAQPAITATHGGELLFVYVLSGELRISIADSGRYALRPDDCCAIPPHTEYTIDTAPGLQWLEVRTPAADSGDQ